MRLVAGDGPIEPNLAGLLKVLSTPYFYCAGVCYGGALILFTLAVSRLELSVAYSTIVSGSIVVVTVLSVVFFREPVTVAKVLGIVLVLAGVLLIHRSA